jgi:hypothetical protein
MGKPHLAIRIPPPLLAALNSYVERVGTSKTDVVVSAIAKRCCKQIATYLGCAESVPLSQRMAEVERKVAELETEVRGHKR